MRIMSYVKMAKQLKESASTGKTMRETTQNVRETVMGFLGKPGVTKQDLVLAMGYAVHYCDYEAAMPAQTALMLSFEDMTDAAKRNPVSAYIAGSSVAENLKHVREAMKEEMARTETNVLDKGGMVARAVYDSPSDGAQSAILTVAEALSRDWDKDNTLDC